MDQIDINDPNILELLQTLMDNGSLDSMFSDYGNKQQEIDQQMALADQLRQQRPERSTPMGALFGGLGNLAGGIGGALTQKKAMGLQEELGKSKEKDARNRMKATIDALRARGSFLGATAGASGEIDGAPFLGASIGG